MAYEQDGPFVAYPAGADLSTYQWRGVVIDTSGNLQLNTSNGGRILGILEDDPTAGHPGTVRTYGVGKAVAGGTFTIGALLMSNATGQLILATTGLQIVAQALQAGVSGRIVAVKVGYLGIV